MLKGSIVALVTPMFDNGDIHWQQLAQLIDWHIESGTSAIVSVGTTGESATLNIEEHKAVIHFTQRHTRDRIPVIAGAGGNSTGEAIELSLAAYHSGCYATLQVVPYYNKPPQRGLVKHFQTIAEKVPMPHLLYNVPGRTACDLNAQTVAELAKIPNIIGIKEASTLERLRELKALCPSDFLIFSGEDGISAQAYAEGTIEGVISVTANVAPQLMSEVFSERSQAISRNEALVDLHKAMFCECNPLPAKWALHRLGKMDAGIRLPLVPLAPESYPVVESALKRAGLLTI
ncbi:MAG: 4-hydroxy-tetrahydrodipicolinate synthase [Cardiobacteriaceae bacterium]|nr:4-hydroxy-tetrahydrodipicolinate synthase [Cardiobacteriaceae bacterium]